LPCRRSAPATPSAPSPARMRRRPPRPGLGPAPGQGSGCGLAACPGWGWEARESGSGSMGIAAERARHARGAMFWTRSGFRLAGRRAPPQARALAWESQAALPGAVPSWWERVCDVWNSRRAIPGQRPRTPQRRSLRSDVPSWAGSARKQCAVAEKCVAADECEPALQSGVCGCRDRARRMPRRQRTSSSSRRRSYTAGATVARAPSTSATTATAPLTEVFPRV